MLHPIRTLYPSKIIVSNKLLVMDLKDTLKVEMSRGHWVSHSLGLYLLHQIWLKRKRVARQSLLALRARALAKFGEVDTVPVSEKPSALSTFRPLGYRIKP